MPRPKSKNRDQIKDQRITIRLTAEQSRLIRRLGRSSVQKGFEKIFQFFVSNNLNEK